MAKASKKRAGKLAKVASQSRPGPSGKTGGRSGGSKLLRVKKSVAGAVKRAVISPIKGPAVSVVGQEKTHDGRDRWLVSNGTQIVNLTTSASSTAAMHEATVIYADALKRLADR